LAEERKLGKCILATIIMVITYLIMLAWGWDIHFPGFTVSKSYLLVLTIVYLVVLATGILAAAAKIQKAVV